MLVFDGVFKLIDGALLLSNISFTVSSSEVVALVGDSGSGKTTILNSIATLTSVTRGSIYIDGIDISTLDQGEKNEIRKKIGFIHQFHHLLPEFDVLENLIIPQIVSGVSYGVAKRRACELLCKFHLQDLSEREPSQISGGQKQKIAILRAFVNNPKIVLADEPTGNLDERSANELFDFIVKNSRENKTTTVVVTHNYELAKKADRIITMKELINSNA